MICLLQRDFEGSLPVQTDTGGICNEGPERRSFAFFSSCLYVLRLHKLFHFNAVRPARLERHYDTKVIGKTKERKNSNAAKLSHANQAEKHGGILTYRRLRRSGRKQVNSARRTTV